MKRPTEKLTHVFDGEMKEMRLGGLPPVKDQTDRAAPDHQKTIKMEKQKTALLLFPVFQLVNYLLSPKFSFADVIWSGRINDTSFRFT